MRSARAWNPCFSRRRRDARDFRVATQAARTVGALGVAAATPYLSCGAAGCQNAVFAFIREVSLCWGMSDLDSLIRILQASISPIAMVSGIGLLLLSLTNRFGRVTDRIRELRRQRNLNEEEAGVLKQIDILHLRARIIRNAVSAAVGCMLMASFMVLLLFAMAIWHVSAHLFVLLLFGGSIVCLIVTLLLFLWDMRLSLRAVEEELR